MNSLSPTKLQTIRLLAFDYDGVFTDGTILIDSDGKMLRQGHAKDGFAIQWAIKQGLPIAIVSGGKESSVEERMRGLGVEEGRRASASEHGEYLAPTSGLFLPCCLGCEGLEIAYTLTL